MTKLKSTTRKLSTLLLKETVASNLMTYQLTICLFNLFLALRSRKQFKASDLNPPRVVSIRHYYLGAWNRLFREMTPITHRYS